MNREYNLRNLKHGSYDKIKKAYENGSGVFYREDVGILLDLIQELEEYKFRYRSLTE